MNPNLSIIIPAYNCQNYLVRCIESIYSLPLNKEEFEVIIIDDNSTDNTKSVISNQQSLHNNIKLIEHNKNMRLGAARNHGLDIAKGDYIMFCDADDEAGIGVYDALKEVEKKELDICFFTLNLEKDNGTFLNVKWNLNSKETPIDGKTFLNNHFDFYLNGSTRGIFRRTLIEEHHLRYKEFVRWEDGDFCLRLYKNARSIGFVDSVGYIYYRNLGSISFTTTGSAIAERIGLGCRLIKLALQEFKPSELIFDKIIEEAQWRYFYQNLRLRNLTKISWRENLIMHKNLTKSDWDLVSKYTLSKWEKVVCRHFYMASIVLFFACPIARLGRYIINKNTKS